MFYFIIGAAFVLLLVVAVGALAYNDSRLERRDVTDRLIFLSDLEG